MANVGPMANPRLGVQQQSLAGLRTLAPAALDGDASLRAVGGGPSGTRRHCRPPSGRMSQDMPSAQTSTERLPVQGRWLQSQHFGRIIAQVVKGRVQFLKRLGIRNDFAPRKWPRTGREGTSAE